MYLGNNMNILRLENFGENGFEVEFDLLTKQDEVMAANLIGGFFVSEISQLPPTEEIKAFTYTKGERYIFQYQKDRDEISLVTTKSETKNFTVRLSPADEYLIGEKSKQYGFKSIGEYLRFVGIHSDIKVSAPERVVSPRTTRVSLQDMVLKPNELEYPLLVIVDREQVKGMKEEAYLRHYFEKPLELQEWAKLVLDINKVNPIQEYSVIENTPKRDNHAGYPDVCTKASIKTYSGYGSQED